MRFLIFCLGFILAVLMFWGCQARCHDHVRAPAFYVPGVMIAATSPDSQINPFQVLPASETEDFFIGRPEKFVYGSYPTFQISAYSIYTYDAQRISTPWEGGWRYTYSLRAGESIP